MRRVWLILSGLLFIGTGLQSADAQEAVFTLSDRAPRFMLSSMSGGSITPRVVDASTIVALRRDVTIEFTDTTLGQALYDIGQQIGVHFVYSAESVPVDMPVHLKATGISAAGALSELLMGKDLDILFKSATQAVLVKRDAAVAGSICGAATEANSGRPIADVEIRVLGTSLGSLTDKEGKYCIEQVPVGEYSVSARRLGYRTRSLSGVVVVGGRSTRADFVLDLMPSALDQVVVTGTAIPTERKALPNPITVVTAKQLKQQHINDIDDVFRFFVPGGVTFNEMPGVGGYSLNSVRGTSTLQYLTSTLKVLVDGVQMADVSQLRSIDPNTIDHIEVLTGPEATTIYGSGAISGVMQIFLKHGSSSLTQPQLSGKLAVGTIDNRYNPAATPLRKDGSLSLIGGNGTYGYSVGGSWQQEGAWTRFNDVQETGLFIGARFEQGIVGGNISIRNTRMSGLRGLNPARMALFGMDTTIAPRAVADIRYGTYAGTLRLQPVAGWINTLTLGEDVNSGRVYSSRPATAADAAAERVLEGTYSTDKSSWAVRTVDFKSSYGWSFSDALKFNVAGGANRITTEQSMFSIADSAPPENSSFTGSIYSNQSLDYIQGVFGQGQLSWNDAVFLTVGAHGDRSPGENATVWSPRVGLSVVRRVGPAMVKGRIEYGSSLIAPEPFEKMYIVNRYTIQLANPDLLPQKQRGTDAGLEVYLGNRLSLTGSYYNQMAVDLLTQALYFDPTGSTTQWVNVGKVHNTGWEFTGTAAPFSALSLQFVYGSASSVIQEISSAYIGSYKAGDAIMDVPKWTGGVTAVWTPFDGTSINMAATHTGTQRDIDVGAENAAFGNGTYDGDASTERQFWVDFPAYTTVNLGLTQRLMRNVSAFVQLENIGNVYPLSPYWVVQRGRVSTVGLQFSSF